MRILVTGGAGQNSQEWINTTTKNMRNFIRKWGHAVKHDRLMKPIIPPKYDIGIILPYKIVTGKQRVPICE